MSKPRHFLVRDKGHAEIIDELKKHGVEVVDCSKVGGIPDLLVKWRDQVSFIEIKVPGSKAKWYFDQLRFIADTRFSVGIAKSPSEAILALQERLFLTSKQKDSIAGMLLVSPKKYYTPREVETALGK